MTLMLLAAGCEGKSVFCTSVVPVPQMGDGNAVVTAAVKVWRYNSYDS